MKIDEIHLSLVNGQRRQMVDFIKEYGVADFFSDYRGYLSELYENQESVDEYFVDATNSYFRITER